MDRFDELVRRIDSYLVRYQNGDVFVPGSQHEDVIIELCHMINQRNGCIKAIICLDDEDGSSYSLNEIINYQGKRYKVVDKKFIAVGNTWSEYEYSLKEWK